MQRDIKEQLGDYSIDEIREKFNKLITPTDTEVALKKAPIDAQLYDDK